MTKKEEKYISNLTSGNEQLISDTLEEIREEGNSTLLPYLIDLLNDTKNEEVNKLVYGLLCELKQTSSIPVIIEAINNEKYIGIQETLLRICWENGLDYSPYLSTFIDIVINGDFMNAFEAFTIIENMEGIFHKDETVKLIEKLSLSIEGSSAEKRTLIADLIKLLQ